MHFLLDEDVGDSDRWQTIECQPPLERMNQGQNEHLEHCGFNSLILIRRLRIRAFEIVCFPAMKRLTASL